MLLTACGHDSDGGMGSEAGDDASTTDAPTHAGTGTGSDAGGSDGPGGSDTSGAGDGELFDVGAGAGDEGGGTDGRGEPICGFRECVDTTADAAVLLEPCSTHFADFYPPYDESYECWSVKPGGNLVGDTDVTFAYGDPDLLLLGLWNSHDGDGGIAQVRVTRDAHCNITGLVDADWQPYAENEPGDVRVRGMTWLDDGTMFLARSVSPEPQQVGQRSPGIATTTKLVDAVSLLPPWENLHYGNDNVIVALTAVPPGFPGAGTLKMLAEKRDTSHWFTVPLVEDGNGTYDVGAAIEETTIYPPEDDWGGYYARGIAWIGDDNPEIDVPSVLIPEAWHKTVALYELDAAGNPLPETRTPFVDGLGMPSGAETDTASGNNFVFTGRRSNDVYVIRGCSEAPPSRPPPG